MDLTVFPKGTCTQMCPDSEIHKREKESRLHVLEIITSTVNSKYPKANRKRVVKEFVRSAAGQNRQDLRSLRTPDAILQTTNYLLHDVVTVEHLQWTIVYDFIMDRLRAVRQDMIIQNFTQTLSVNILQPIVKFYTYSAYRLCEEPLSVFDPVINNNHLRECLKIILCLYDDLDIKMQRFPGDDVCRPFMEGLYLIYNLGSTVAMERAIQIPKIWRTSLVEKCLVISLNYWRGNFIKVCQQIKELPVLLQAFAVLHLPKIRKHALAVMSTAFNSKNCKYPIEDLKRILLYDNVDEVISECKYYNVPVDGNQIVFSKTAFQAARNESPPKHCFFVDDLLSRHHIPSLLLEEKFDTFDTWN